MVIRIAAYAAVLLLGVTAAHAQSVNFGPRVSDPGLAPYEVMSIVRSAGLAPLTRPMRYGPSYLVIAADRAGGRMRVVVDAHRGHILAVHPVVLPGPQIVHPGYFYDSPRYGAVPQPYYGRSGRLVPVLPDPDAPMIYGPEPVGIPPMQTRAAPGPQPAAQNPAVASVRPIEPAAPAARPKALPLPRPRPNSTAENVVPAEQPAPSAQPQSTTPAETAPAAPAKQEPAPAAKPDNSESHPPQE